MMKLRGTVELIHKHINNTHREQNTTNILYNFNTLGLVRHTIPQFNKEGALKGATITLITNGGTFSTLEFLSNVQAASNALQRLTEQKTVCDPEQCPPEPLTQSGGQNTDPLIGRDFLLDLVLGRLLIKSEQTPAHTRASLNQGASFISARTVQTASELKPYLKSIVKNSTTRGNFQNAKACDLLVDVAQKAQITPEEFANLQKPKTEPSSSSNIFQDATSLFTKRAAGLVLGKKIPDKPKAFPNKPENDTTNSSSGYIFAPRSSLFSRSSNQDPSEGSAKGKGKSKGKKGGAQKGKQSGKQNEHDWYSYDWQPWGKGGKGW